MGIGKDVTYMKIDFERKRAVGSAEQIGHGAELSS